MPLMSFSNFIKAAAVSGALGISGVSAGQSSGVDYSKEVVNSTEEYRKLLDAIRKVETGASKDPSKAVGDKGKALGPYQIWQSYWKDAVEFDKSIGGSYNDVTNKEYAEKIIRAYWKRYAPKNATFEQLASIHNGGPKAASGKQWQKTEGYRKKVLDQLSK